VWVLESQGFQRSSMILSRFFQKAFHSLNMDQVVNQAVDQAVTSKVDRDLAYKSPKAGGLRGQHAPLEHAEAVLSETLAELAACYRLNARRVYREDVQRVQALWRLVRQRYLRLSRGHLDPLPTEILLRLCAQDQEQEKQEKQEDDRNHHSDQSDNDHQSRGSKCPLVDAIEARAPVLSWAPLSVNLQFAARFPSPLYVFDLSPPAEERLRHETLAAISAIRSGRLVCSWVAHRCLDAAIPKPRILILGAKGACCPFETPALENL
jgi:hypothetical protein